jgi:hypothetical protein
MEMRIEQISYGLISPLPNLCNVFAGLRRQIAGVYDKNFAVTDNHRGISAGVAADGNRVLDGVNAVSKFGYLALTTVYRFTQ